MRRRTRNRMEGVMGIGLLGLSALLALFFLSSYMGNRPSAAQERGAEVVMTSVPPTAEPTMLDVWEGYGRALGAAQAEAVDAQLVSASAQWQAPQEEALLAGADTWAFTFYSDASRRIIDVVVTAERAFVVNQSEAGLAPAPLTNGKWHEGPRDALLVFLAHGARDFLAVHPQATVELRLNQHSDGYPLWNVIAIDSQSRESFTVTVNAASMAMVSVTR
jgi:hypothetical protein